MASRVNHNTVYEHIVEGITPWEKLRVIRNFMTERSTQLDKANNQLLISKLKIKILKKELEGMIKGIDRDIKELEINDKELDLPMSNAVIARATDEVEFLVGYHKECMALAEQTRIEGYDDEQMFESNYEFELGHKYLLDLQSDMLAYGKPSNATIKSFMKFPMAVQLAIENGFANEDSFLPMIGRTSDLKRGIELISNQKLLIKE